MKLKQAQHTSFANEKDKIFDLPRVIVTYEDGGGGAGGGDLGSLLGWWWAGSSGSGGSSGQGGGSGPTNIFAEPPAPSDEYSVPTIYWSDEVPEPGKDIFEQERQNNPNRIYFDILPRK